MLGQTVTISFFHYKGKDKWWAFRQMKTAYPKLEKVEGLEFFKLLGSGGGNGFSIFPDFSVYAVLGVWNAYEAAQDGLKSEGVFNHMQRRAIHHLHVYMKSVRSKGTWGGKNPFKPLAAYQEGLPIAVLTRATIAPTKLLSFWRNVPEVSRKLDEHAKGLLFSKGIGELPLVQQATFSIWKSREKMMDYAYRGENHREMIRKTNDLQWYTEEMFTEFLIHKLDHQWPGLVFDMGSPKFMKKDASTL